jgi:pyruvate,water dikinase
MRKTRVQAKVMVDQVPTLAELTPEEQRSAGGKGCTLARLHQTGYPVPDGFVVLPGAFTEDELKPEAWSQVKTHLARLRGDDARVAFAVRSSALVEDSPRASFAGAFETVLDVRTDEMIRSAILTVRISRRSERVRAYSQARERNAEHPGGVHGKGDPEMAVVVQRLVRADISGVLFTADPVTGSRDRMMGNYVHGLGEQLVSGAAEPHEFTLARPKGDYEGPPELKRFARRLFKLAKSLERDLGGPQDIEWCIADATRPKVWSLGWFRNELSILQSRPITTLQGFDPVTGEFNDSLTGDYFWSCVNLGEAVSVVMTPFTWSVMYTGFGELNILPGHSSVGNIGGRLYQNSTVMVSVLRALGKDFKDLVIEMGGVRDEYLRTMDQYLVPLPDATLLTVLPNALRVRRKEKAGLKKLAAFFAENPGWCRAVRRQIQAMQTGEELASFMEAELIPRSLEAFWKTYATALRYGERVGPLRRELTELVGAADADMLLSNVSGDDELLASLGPVVGLARVARGETTREAYLEQWGHRGALETEMSSPRPVEDPEWLDQQLATFARSPVDVEALLAAQRAKFEAAWKRLRERHPRKAKSMRRRLERAAEAARTREAARSESTRVIWVVRAWVLRAGDLTGLGNGAFFLTIDELLGFLAGDHAPVAYIPARRTTYQRYQALPPYPLAIRGRFDPFRWAKDPARRSDVFDSHGLMPVLAVQPLSENVIVGMPGSAGQAEGVVRCLDDPKQGDELKTGEILVASQTNIGWTLFFPRASAIVTDIGAPLSHAAIVARELGIPAVVNCGDATARLRTGDRVRVDGVQGTVEIIECEPFPPRKDNKHGARENKSPRRDP